MSKGPFYSYGLTLTSNHMLSKMWDATFDIWEWISNFILYFIMDLITYPHWD